MVLTERDRFDVFIFYFDLIGITDEFIRNPAMALDRVEEFQRLVRERCNVAVPGSTLITCADNVWARIHGDEHDAVLEIVEETMRAASDQGFTKFFGALTFGPHTPDLLDGTLYTNGGTEIYKQHIGMTSEPHVRAAMAEKWSAGLAKLNRSPSLPSTIWAGAEALAALPVGAVRGRFQQGPSFDLSHLPLSAARPWPFRQAKFTPIWR